MTPAELDEIEARAGSARTWPCMEILMPFVRTDVPRLIAEVRRLKKVEAAAIAIDDAATNFEAWRQAGWHLAYLTDAEKKVINDLHAQLREALQSLALSE